ncbi:uncharacterized protein [Penaeus vannamei]|uniref:uncharacterized protein n=1 Tax=Penaeus vannamei TaxID=6689 RepID=UPI00387F4ADD
MAALGCFTWTVLENLKDPVVLWDSFKRESLDAAQESVGEQSITEEVESHFLNRILFGGGESAGALLKTPVYVCVFCNVAYSDVRVVRTKMHLPKSSLIMALNPYLDEDGVLRVGGRLQQSSLRSYQKHPIILPGKSHISTLIVRHYHQSVRHQGRHLTEGAVRSGGYWTTGVKWLISSILHSCVQCRKLRGKEEVQLMSDLPADRLEHTPPFTNVGVDAFGPWTITTRRTRGGSANSKRWAILFTCLSTRAIHIELVEEMSSSAFINALKRFEALRGKVKLYRSDRGTNFVGATDSLKIDAVNVEEKKIVDHLYQTGTKWIFNAPHSSHMGGVWERLIRICRKILESVLAELLIKL